MKTILLMLLGLLAASAHAAEPGSARQIEQELEQQMKALTDTPPAEVELFLAGLDSSEYQLKEVSFTLDGEPLTVPAVEALTGPGPHRLALKQVKDGPHRLVTRITYVNASWSLFSPASGFLWKLASTVNFQVQRGLRVRLKAVPRVVPEAEDPREQLTLSHEVEVEMTARVDDSPLPEPPPRSLPAPDAGPTAMQPEPSAPQQVPPTEPGAGQPRAGSLRVQVMEKGKPLEAMVLVSGDPPRHVPITAGRREPPRIEVEPGPRTLDVLARGYLAQRRQVHIPEGTEVALSFNLTRAPKKRRVAVKETRLELLKPLQFNERKAAPRPAPEVVAELVDAVIRHRVRRLRVEGHADNREKDSQQLSEARARAVAELLMAAGLDPAGLETVGLGADRPVAPNITPRGRQLNRRVEFVILEKLE